MGWADLLLLMKVRYDSPKALALADKVAAFLRAEATAASRDLAAERGSFPAIAQSVYKGGKMRNATVFTIAPTGTISRIAGCSSSIEPVFAFEVDLEDHRLRAQGRPPPLRRVEGEEPRQAAARVLPGRPRDRPRMAHQDPGGLPEARRQLRLQDHQLPPRGLGRRRRKGLPRWPGTWAPRASPSTATAAARARSSTRTAPRSSTPRAGPTRCPRSPTRSRPASATST